jgi:hypothetical protein
MSPIETPIAAKKPAKRNAKHAGVKKYDGPTRQERVEAAHEALIGHLETMVSGDDWKALLTLASKFHNYSANNCILISMQCPNATRVASFNKWKELGRYVKKGAKQISILAPSRVKVDDDDGFERFVLAGFKTVGVFDISQTEGLPLDEPDIATLLEGEAPAGMWDAIASLIEKDGYTISFGDTSPANGTSNHVTRQVIISETLCPAAAVKTLVHELAHTMQSPDYRKTVTRDIMEVSAESVAYLVCQAFGIESAPYSIGYVAGWSGGNVATVRTTAEWVVRTAHEIITESLDTATEAGTGEDEQ